MGHQCLRQIRPPTGTSPRREIRVEQQTVSEMVAPVVRLVQETLARGGVAACVVGELALNYYNVPRVVHDVEFCVGTDELEKAASLLQERDGVSPAALCDFDLYTAHLQGFPRFRCDLRDEPPAHVVLFSAASMRLDPIKERVVPRELHSPAAQYSREILESLAAPDLQSVDFPRLAPFFAGLCRRWLDASDGVARIAAEQLVDGMDLDEAWCRRNLLPSESSACVQFALELVSDKKSRVDHFVDHAITCFVGDKDEVEKLRKIPGADET
ncbi:hypothetical protein BDY21DRAFT_408775 [Lineolata rhizophorae]|uniref:Uncharacterized protein n=1 Tax=Lineolata rhizophorae TaxID=578093 RepID=A0A6A6P6C3_9PEZI|nr:hypothetical protein BDY21DRAFT_408775 [Lineolata rhizophorae]